MCDTRSCARMCGQSPTKSAACLRRRRRGSRIAVVRGKETERSFGLTNSKPTFVIENKGGDRGLTLESAPNNAVPPAEVSCHLSTRDETTKPLDPCLGRLPRHGRICADCSWGRPSEVVEIRATTATPRNNVLDVECRHPVTTGASDSIRSALRREAPPVLP